MTKLKPSRRNGSRTRHSYSDYRRLSPDENERQGFSRTARHYVLKNVKRVTQRTPSITARAHETLRTRQVHGLASPEQATQARREGGLSYSSARPSETGRKGRGSKADKKARESVGEWLPYITSKKGNDSASFHDMREWKPLSAIASASCAANGSTMANGLR